MTNVIFYIATGNESPEAWSIHSVSSNTMPNLSSVTVDVIVVPIPNECHVSPASFNVKFVVSPWVRSISRSAIDVWSVVDFVTVVAAGDTDSLSFTPAFGVVWGDQ